MKNKKIKSSSSASESFQINKEKVALIKRKFAFLRKIKPLKTKKNKQDTVKFNPKNAKNIRDVDMAAIWEKSRRDRTSEERYYYRKEKHIYYSYFLLYLSREMRRTRWINRKSLLIKFLITIAFIAFFAGLAAALQPLIIMLFTWIKLFRFL